MTTLGARLGAAVPRVGNAKDARGLLVTYAVLLFMLPAQLIFAPLGASGSAIASTTPNSIGCDAVAATRRKSDRSLTIATS